MSNTIELTWTEEDEDENSESYGDEIEFVETFPAKMEVCPNCEGHGTHLREGMRYHAYTREEFENEFDDEMKEEYFKRGGIYDVQCSECKGLRVVPVVNEDALNKEQKELYARYQKYEEERAQDDAAYEAECRMERLMGC